MLLGIVKEPTGYTGQQLLCEKCPAVSCIHKRG